MNPDFANLPLRDPHLPEPISWWPPAPGWWGLLILFILTSILGLALLARFRRTRVKRDALRVLNRLEVAFHSGADMHKAVAAISILVRRVSLSLYPREQVASLTGERWLSFLDESINEKAQAGRFSQGAGRAIAEAPYNPAYDVDLPSLLTLTRHWISTVEKPKPEKPELTKPVDRTQLNTDHDRF